jgi:hypothetical protein
MKLSAVPEPPARNAHLNARRTWPGATIYARQNLRPTQTQNRMKKEPRCVKAGFEGWFILEETRGTADEVMPRAGIATRRRTASL